MSDALDKDALELHIKKHAPGWVKIALVISTGCRNSKRVPHQRGSGEN